jgi:hypothetical protein
VEEGGIDREEDPSDAAACRRAKSKMQDRERERMGERGEGKSVRGLSGSEQTHLRKRNG